MEWIDHLFGQYGYWLLFFGLLAESIALPFPGELAMAYAGHLADRGELHLMLVYACVFLGATIGTTITYVIGHRLGMPFFEKHGKLFMLTPAKLEKFRGWFDKYGNKLLLVSYFIPGLRHFTGYVSGILGIPLRTFMLFNHTGALLWVLVYVTLGNRLGNNWERIIHHISKYSLRIAIFAVIVIGVVIAVRKLRAPRHRGQEETGSPSSPRR